MRTWIFATVTALQLVDTLTVTETAEGTLESLRLRVTSGPSRFERQEFVRKRAEFGIGIGIANEGNDHEL